MPTATPTTESAPKVHGALLAVQVLFASLSVAGKLVLVDLPPRGLVAARVSAAALVFLAVRLLSPAIKMSRRDLAATALHAMFGVVANQLFFVEGLKRTTAINAIVVQSLIPVFTVAVAVVLRREKATIAKVIGLAVAVGGVALLVGLDRVEGGHVAGNLLVSANALCFSIYLVISRPMFTRYGTVEVVTWTFVFGAVAVVPFGAQELFAHAPSMSPTAVTALTWIVIGPTVGTYFLNGWALRRAPSSLVAVYIYVQPVFGAVFAAVILHERPSTNTLLGAALIATGIAIVSNKRGLLQSRP